MAGVMKGAFSLPEEVITIEFIKRQRGSITNPRHVMFGGVLEASKRILVPKRNRTTFKYLPVLDKKEQTALETMMGLDDGTLGAFKVTNNFWDDVTVEVKKEGVKLDLSDPMQYIKYKVVLQYKNTIAESLATLKARNKQTYRFVIVRKGEKSNDAIAKYTVKKEAYKIADLVESDMNKLKEFLFLMGSRVASTTSLKVMKAKLAEFVEDSPHKVVEIYTAKDYTTRAILARGVLSGIIKDAGGRYLLEDGLELAEEGKQGTLGNAILFLTSPSNKGIRNQIEAKLGDL